MTRRRKIPVTNKPRTESGSTKFKQAQNNQDQNNSKPETA